MDRLDKHIDAVLRAAGSSLRHYTMQMTRDRLRAAMSAAIEEELELERASPAIPREASAFRSGRMSSEMERSQSDAGD